MSTWINGDYFFERRGRIFVVGEEQLRDLDINFSAKMNPGFMGDCAQAALDKLAETYPDIVPAGSACMALQWALDYHG